MSVEKHSGFPFVQLRCNSTGDLHLPEEGGEQVQPVNLVQVLQCGRVTDDGGHGSYLVEAPRPTGRR